MTATDPDVGQTLSYSIIGGADASKFTIGSTTGALSFVTAPNFELPTDAGGNNVYDVIVQVSDGHGGIDTQAIAVTVTDVFENSAPIITSNGGGDTAAVSIAENTTAVTTVTATDPDVGQTLSYSIIGGADASKFTIGSTTGALSFVTAPNFELPTDAGGNNVYDVIVQVSDGHGGIDTQAIAVTVTDVLRTSAPIITSNGGGDTAAVSIAENTTAVTTVTATDPDVGQTLSYSIIGGADASKFTIGSSTGALSFVTAPNFELPTDAGGNNVYDVIVQVSDGHGGIDTQAIAVTVTDVFENSAPIITSNGGGDTAAVSIAENTTAVTTVTATDPDVGQTLSYSIIGGADASKFTIGASTGALSFVTAPNFELPTDAGGNNVYDVIVQASDGHGGIDTQAIAVTVTDVFENSAPIITSGNFSLTAGADTVVGGAADDTVYATAATLNAGDSLTGGAGTDVLQLVGSGTFRVDQVGTFTGFETIALDNATNSTAQLTLGSQPIEVDATGYLSVQAISPSNWNGSNIIKGDASQAWATTSLNFYSNWNYPQTPATYDLTSNTLSHIGSVTGNGNDLTLLVNSADTTNIQSFSAWGANDRLVTAGSTLDLSHTTVSGFTVTSTNGLGTAFTVGDLGTAFQIAGGSGQDTLIAQGFTLTADQRIAIFETSSVETIVDQSGTYAAPLPSPGILGLTSSNDTVVAPASGSTVYATAATLNAGDSLTGGAGTDVLQLVGSGTFRVDQVGTFTGFERSRSTTLQIQPRSSRWVASRSRWTRPGI